ncbi:MAG: hypothetical protein J5502_03580 [Prevotella sp.]|nr:hypothetical protein [Prevotella sp.]
MMKRAIILFFFLSVAWKVCACTSIVVSGKASADGRPFIFKNGDGRNMDIVTASFQGEKYFYSAIISAKVSKPDRVSSGFNETGFSIINTDGHNLNSGKANNINNTRVMRRALEVCATLKDFETLLDTLHRPLHMNSNFGVMDATGGVAYYEVGNKSYVKYDANDPKVAPKGYLIRSNYGMSGDKSRGVGFERYKAMEMFVDGVKRKGKINYKDVIRGASRYLTHGETKVNLLNHLPKDASIPVFVTFDNFIPRIQTINAQLIQGIKPGEHPLETVAWTICGSPLTTVCIPVWINSGHSLPKILSRKSNGHSPMTDVGLELKKRLFPKSKKRKPNEINLAQLVNQAGTGILQKLEPVEDEIFHRADRVLRSVRKRGSAGTEADTFYKWLDQYVPTEYNKRFGIKEFFYDKN